MFVAVGNEGALINFSDGIAWTARDSRTDERLRGVAFGMGVRDRGATPESDHFRRRTRWTTGTPARGTLASRGLRARDICGRGLRAASS